MNAMNGLMENTLSYHMYDICIEIPGNSVTMTYMMRTVPIIKCNYV